MTNIDTYAVRSGRAYKENGDVVNTADLLENIVNNTSINNDPEKTIAVVINGQSTDEIDVRGYRLAVIEMPSAWDGSALSFYSNNHSGWYSYARC